MTAADWRIQIEKNRPTILFLVYWAFEENNLLHPIEPISIRRIATDIPACAVPTIAVRAGDSNHSADQKQGER